MPKRPVAGNLEQPAIGVQRPRRWKRLLWQVPVAVLLVAVAYAGWKVYRGVSVSLQAEENLHATLFTVQLVERFVAQHGRWPRSWGELEALAVRGDAPAPQPGQVGAVCIGGSHGYDWPAASPELQRRVSIDFAADLAQVAAQDAMAFTAIKPIGPYYEYRDYGFVQSLQATLRRSMK
jgi:hypothetical protein